MTDTQRIDELEKQVKLLVLKLDEARRRLGLSSMVDEQAYQINSRLKEARVEPH
jgi:hypothetical protein